MTDQNVSDVGQLKDIEEIFHWFRRYSGEYAKAKSDRVYLEHFRKSKLAILREQYRVEYADEKITESRLDNMARSNQEYLELLLALQAATETEERLGMIVTGIKLRVDTWRTEQANDRTERKGYGA